MRVMLSEISISHIDMCTFSWIWLLITFVGDALTTTIVVPEYPVMSEFRPCKRPCSYLNPYYSDEVAKQGRIAGRLDHIPFLRYRMRHFATQVDDVTAFSKIYSSNSNTEHLFTDLTPLLDLPSAFFRSGIDASFCNPSGRYESLPQKSKSNFNTEHLPMDIIPLLDLPPTFFPFEVHIQPSKSHDISHFDHDKS